MWSIVSWFQENKYFSCMNLQSLVLILSVRKIMIVQLLMSCQMSVSSRQPRFIKNIWIFWKYINKIKSMPRLLLLQLCFWLFSLESLNWDNLKKVHGDTSSILGTSSIWLRSVSISPSFPCSSSALSTTGFSSLVKKSCPSDHGACSLCGSRYSIGLDCSHHMHTMSDSSSRLCTTLGSLWP